MSLWLILLARSAETGNPAWVNRPIRWSTVANLVFFVWLAAYPVVRLNCEWVMTYSGREIYRLPAPHSPQINKPLFVVYYPLLKVESAFSEKTFLNPFIEPSFP